MWSLICLHLLVAAAGQVHGIKLSLTEINGVDVCGKVRCIEETSNGETIKNLTIRKQLESDVVLVEMSQQQPSFISKKDDINTKGIWAIGSLSSQRAEVQVDLHNSEDCNNAEFICDIVHLNKLGVERVSSSSGRITGMLGPKIEELSSSVENQKTKLEILTEKLETLTDTTKIEELSSSVENQKTKLESLTEKLETLTDTTKIDELSSSVENQKTKLESLTESVSTILSKLEDLTDTMKEELSPSVEDQKTKLESLTEKLETLTDTMNKRPTTCQRGQRPSLDNRYQVVYPTDGTPFSYLCDTDGGWTVIQRRINGKTDFYRNWSSYKYGFGSFFEDFWLGLERIYQITYTYEFNYELNITMKFKGKLYYAHYDNFKVSGEWVGYKLSIGAYSGTAGDSLSYHNNMRFSTLDRDNNQSGARKCANKNNGAWWYKGCYQSNLNGNWGVPDERGVMWFALSHSEPVTMTELKIRKMLY